MEFGRSGILKFICWEYPEDMEEMINTLPPGKFGDILSERRMIREPKNGDQISIKTKGWKNCVM